MLRNEFGIYEHPLPADPSERLRVQSLARIYKARTGRNLLQQRDPRQAMIDLLRGQHERRGPRDIATGDRTFIGDQDRERFDLGPQIGGSAPTYELEKPILRAKVNTDRNLFGKGLTGVKYATLWGGGAAPTTAALLGLQKGSEVAQDQILPRLSGLKAPSLDTAGAADFAGNDPDKQDIVRQAALGLDFKGGLSEPEVAYLARLAKQHGASDEDIERSGTGGLLRLAYPPKRSVLGFAGNAVNDVATTFLTAPAGAAGAVRALGSSIEQGSLAPATQYAGETFVQPFVDLADDPSGYAYEHPWQAALLASGALRGVGAVGGRAFRRGARRPIVLDKIPGRDEPVVIDRPGRAPSNLVDRAAAASADAIRDRSSYLQERFARRDASSLGGRTRTAAQNAAVAQTAEIRNLMQKMSPEEQVRYQWADSKGLTPEHWITRYEAELAQTTEAHDHAIRQASDETTNPKTRRKWEARVVELENRARDLREQANGWRHIAKKTKPTPPDLKARLDAAHAAADARNRPFLTDEVGLPAESIEARRFAETRMLRGDLPADDAAAMAQLEAEGVNPFYTRNAPATRAGDAFRGAKSPIPHTDPTTAGLAPGSAKRWTGRTIREGRLNVDPEQVLRATERPQHAQPWLRGVNAFFDRYGRTGRPGEVIDQRVDVAIDRNRLRQLQKEARQDDGGTWEKILDESEQTGDAFDTTIGVKATDRVPVDGDIVIVPKDLLAQFKGQVMPTRLGRKAGMFGQATDAWRLAHMYPRPGYHTMNMGTAGFQGLLGGVGPRAIFEAYRNRGEGIPRHLSSGTQSSYYGPRMRDVPNAAGEYTGRSGLRRPFTNQRGELGGPIGTLIKPLRTWGELWRRGADALEQTLHDATYLKKAGPEARRRAEQWGTDYMDELKKLAAEEDVQPNNAKAVTDTYGDFTKRRNEGLALGSPFYRFYNAMLHDALVNMPLRHPNRALLLSLLADQGQEELDRLGLPLLPGMAGAIPVLTGGGKAFGVDIANISPHGVPFQLLAGEDGQIKNPASILAGVANPLITDTLEPFIGGSLRGEPRAFKNERGERYGIIGAVSKDEASPNSFGDSLRTLGQRYSRYPLGAFGSLFVDRGGKADTSIDVVSEQPRYQSLDEPFRRERDNRVIERVDQWFGLRTIRNDTNDPSFRPSVLFEWSDLAGDETPSRVRGEIDFMGRKTSRQHKQERYDWKRREQANR